MTDRTLRRVVDILLVEDDEGDVLITREAFQHYRIRNALHVVSDGDRALQFVRRKGEASSRLRSTCVSAARCRTASKPWAKTRSTAAASATWDWTKR